jgi:hypothetical protein
MLYITNEDSAASTIKKVRSGVEVMPWRDTLYDGPAPGGLDLEQLSDIRVRYLADNGMGKYKEIRKEFGMRDRKFLSMREAVLWFGNGLNDQLQLVQILDGLHGRKGGFELICVGEVPGRSDFPGLGEINVDEMKSLWSKRQKITPEMTGTASRVWTAFRSPDRKAVEQIAQSDLSPLPFLRAALRRLLEEYPDPATGLARTERQILECVRDGKKKYGELLRAVNRMEESPFLSDFNFKLCIAWLSNGKFPLLSQPPFELTPFGHKVLAGEENASKLNGLDRWIGGVRLLA